MRPLTALTLTVLLLLAFPGGSRAQVLRELEPIHLVYNIHWGEAAEIVGTCTVSFEPVDTKRGRRLEVKSATSYTLPTTVPLEYEETCEMTCDDTGVVRFSTEARALGQERINVGLRVGEHFQVTTTFGGKTSSNTITSGVRQSNFALFAGAFLPNRLDEDGMFIEFPLLYPVGGDHHPRLKFREATQPFPLASGRTVGAINTRIKRQNETSDFLWNVATGHQILLKMEQQDSQGPLTYHLLTVNDVPVGESELVR